MIFDYHIGTSKFDVKIYDGTQCQKEYEAEVHFHYSPLYVISCSGYPLVCLSVISNELLSCAFLIDRPWEQIVVLRCSFDILSGYLEPYLFCRISGCEQPSNMSQIIADTESSIT
jgi:hypothetical protein